MSRAKRFLLLSAELALWAVFAFLAFISAVCFDTARQTPVLWEYLAPERMEEVWGKWIWGGVVFAIPALGTLAGAAGMGIYRRRKKGSSK